MGIRSVYLSPEVLIQFMREGCDLRVRIVEGGIPESARLIGEAWDASRRGFLMTFEDASWEGPEEGQVIPEEGITVKVSPFPAGDNVG